MAATPHYDDKRDAHYVLVCHEGQREKFYKGINSARDADALAKEINVDIAQKRFSLRPKAKKIKLETFGQLWLDDNERGIEITTTALREFNCTTYIYPVLGHKLIHTVSRDDVKGLLKSLRDRMSDVSAKGIIGHLNTLMEAAKEAGYITSNPASRVRNNVRTKRSKQNRRAMTETQVKAFLTAIEHPAQPKVGPKYDHLDLFLSFFMLLARTGIRMGEAFAAQWSQFDFRSRQFTVRMALSKATGQERLIWKDPKNGLIRKVDLSEQLCDQLQYFRDLNPDADTTSVYSLTPWKKFDWKAYRAALKAGRKPIDLLPTAPDRQSLAFPMVPRVFSEKILRGVMQHAVKTLKDGTYTAHELRHSYASIIISRDGSKLPYVSRQLGHATVQETFDTYGHLIPSEDRSTVNMLDDVAYVPKHRSRSAPATPFRSGKTSQNRPENLRLLRKTATHDE